MSAKTRKFVHFSISVALFAILYRYWLVAPALMLTPALSTEVPSKFLPSIQDRQRSSDIVCSATILKTYTTCSTKQLEGQERSEWIAKARVDRIFKGFLGSRVIAFKYYGLGPRTVDYFGPPFADFQPGNRYVVFLRGSDSNLTVAVPFYRIEIELSPKVQLDDAKTSPERALVRELLFAIESSPGTTGRMATHYFSWVEELVGKESVSLVSPFLNSADPLVQYQAAWWLSFRDIEPTVINELRHAAQDETIEEWARSGARDRLRDIDERKWVP